LSDLRVIASCCGRDFDVGRSAVGPTEASEQSKDVNTNSTSTQMRRAVAAQRLVHDLGCLQNSLVDMIERDFTASQGSFRNILEACMVKIVNMKVRCVTSPHRPSPHDKF